MVWHSAHWSAVLNAPRKEAALCTLRRWLWWILVKTISGPCLTFGKMKKKIYKKGSLPRPPYTHTYTPQSSFVQRCLKIVCLRRSPLLPLISIVIMFVCRASLGLKLLWCRWWLRAKFYEIECSRWGPYVYARHAAIAAAFGSAAVAVNSASLVDVVVYRIFPFLSIVH